MKRAHLLRHFFVAALLAVCVLSMSRDARAQNSYQFTVSSAPVGSLSIGDIDFKNGGSQSWFFSLNITGPTHQPPVNDVVLSVAVNIQLSDGTNYTNAVTAVTMPFSVNGQLSVSNIDLGKGTNIKMSSFTYSSTAENNLKQQALATGKLPAGTYQFYLTLSTTDGTPISGTNPQIITFNLQNTTTLALVAPINNSTVPNPFPFFQWQYSGTNIELAVYEFTSAMHSPQEAASGVPMLDVKSGDPAYPNFPNSSSTFQYPSSGAGVRPLQAGHTYVWRVTGLPSGSGGSGGAVNTDLWQFTVQSSGGSADSSGTGGLTNTLVDLYGTPSTLLAALGNGTLTITGNMYVNGVLVSAADVQKILNELAQNPDEIISIVVSE
jgi:hypothetical protein